VQHSLLFTKLYFPTIRQALVPRPRLVERLQAGLQGSLTLLSAPAGAGKTILLSEWHAGVGTGRPVAWLSLDAGDNDLIRFLQYLSTAIDSLQPGFAKEVLPLLQSTEIPNSEAVLTFLINHLRDLKKESILILDDYHLIELPAIHTSLAFLLDHLPPQLHLVLLTRADPPLPLARLRARGQLTEIRAEHLRFNEAEAARFLNQVMGLGLSGEQIAALEKRTEGWVAGLQLAALSLQGRENVDEFVSEFTGSDHYIVDYLAEEVLNRLPEQLRVFLIETSILERLTGPLCDVLTGQSNGSETLEGLEHANLFLIPLDHEQCWYRYHHLFADLLRGRLLHFLPDEIPDLHFKASKWFEENGFLDEAINHAVEAKDFDGTARLICKDSLWVIYNRSINTLDRWLSTFPKAFVLKDPRLCITRVHILWSSGRRDEIEPYLLVAQKLLTESIASGSRSLEEPETRSLQGEIYTFLSLSVLNKGEINAAVELAQDAIKIIPENARQRAFALGGLYMIYYTTGDLNLAAEVAFQTVAAARLANYPSMHSTAAYTLAQLLRAQGKLRQARKVLLDSLAYVERQGQACLFYNGVLHVGLAEILYEWNELDEMESELETGINLLRQGGTHILVQTGMFGLALLRHARGDMPGAQAMLADIERECKGMDPRTYQDECNQLRLRWQAEQGDLTGLAEQVSRIELNVPEKIGYGRFAELSCAAECLCALNRMDEAVDILEKIDIALQKNEIFGRRIFVLVLQAVTRNNQKDEKRALDCLREALILAEPEGYVRVFLNRGESMRDLLRQLQKLGGGSEFVKRILGVFVPRPPIKALPALKPAILSKREVELLRLVAAGHSNKEIAAELFISLGTVKRHTVNIFTKLDVRNRTEAVAKARQLGLL
jgi:LuxR family transcriptional regulator, maltose regulon positive regulatory protein